MNIDELTKMERAEFQKRDRELCVIASENYPSEKVLEASGSIFQLKYAEGFPYKRYYQGTVNVDWMEQTCISKVLELFNATDSYYANVQPNSGASANMIVYNAVLEPNDKVLAMDVKAGGHISHSHPKSFLSKYNNVQSYGVNDNGELDYDSIRKQALEFRPKLIVAGASNYSLQIDFKRFKEIADEVGAYLMCDIAHISLLCAKGEHPTPVGLADFITFTTHKMLAGPRGGVIIYKKEFDKQIKLSTIPSLFGGPLEHQIYAKLVCFEQQLDFEGDNYSLDIIHNAEQMVKALTDLGLKVVTGRTENHLCTLDLTGFSISGKEFAELLEDCGVVANCNTVPNDPRSFLETSGVRFGVPAITTRGLDCCDVYSLFKAIGELALVFKGFEPSDEEIDKKSFALKSLVNVLCNMYPLSNIYPNTCDRLGIKVKDLQWV